MKNKWIIAACLAALLPLSGCQLAQADTGSAPSEDRLVGVLVTTEHLDLFDFDRYLNDNLYTVLNSGGDITVSGDTSAYEGRLYASQYEDDHPRYKFEGVEGWMCLSLYDEESDCSYTDTNGIETSIHYFVGDEEESTDLTGTLYLSIESGGKQYCVNPVYQSADGSVYAMSGNSYGFEGETSPGELFRISMESSVTTTESGVSKTESSSVTAVFEAVYPTKELTVVQMNSENQILTETTYSVDQLPESITPEENAAYLIFESHSVDENSEPIVSYQLCGQEAAWGFVYDPQEDGTCLKKSIELNWAG